MYRSSPFRSTLNTGYITALDKCKVWTPFGHFCPYFHNPYTLLCLKDDFTFTFPRGLIWKFDNPSTTLSLAPGKFDNPYKGAESAGCHKHVDKIWHKKSDNLLHCLPFIGCSAASRTRSWAKVSEKQTCCCCIVNLNKCNSNIVMTKYTRQNTKTVFPPSLWSIKPWPQKFFGYFDS